MNLKKKIEILKFKLQKKKKKCGAVAVKPRLYDYDLDALLLLGEEPNKYTRDKIEKFVFFKETIF